MKNGVTAERRSELDTQCSGRHGKESTRWLVFERVKGSLCWTLAHKTPRDEMTPGVACDFVTLQQADAFVRDVMSKRRGWWAGKPNQRPMESWVVPVRLPA